MTSGKTKASIVVAIARLVPVTVGRTDVPAVVDPGTTTQDPTNVLFMAITLFETSTAQAAIENLEPGTLL